MRRILVPTDFSPTAEKAFRYALDLALNTQATIILYHIYHPVDGPFIDVKQTGKQYNIQAETNLLKRLQRLKKKITKETDTVTVSTLIGRPPLIDNILGFAENNHIDLVVMGTRGTSELKKIMIGSTAAKVAEEADVPVLLVPEKFEPGEHKQIVFASDYHKSDPEALSLAAELLKPENCTITVLHLFSAYATETERKSEKENFDKYTSQLQQQFDQYTLRFHLLETTSFSETIKNLDKKIPYDLLVMVRRKKTFFQKLFGDSFTQMLTFLAKKPMLIIPGEENISNKVKTGNEPKSTAIKNHLLDKLTIKKIKLKAKD
ncbi:MAG TPA: universal stress protein [Agriterribacter sp.]|nr:universal stress protein [Agriterribacter sp.]